MIDQHHLFRSWCDNVLRYSAAYLSGQDPKSYPNLMDAWDWYRKHDGSRRVPPPSRLRSSVELLEDIERYLLESDAGAAFHETAVPYMRRGGPRESWLDRLGTFPLRERPERPGEWAEEFGLDARPMEQLIGISRAWRDVVNLVRIAARREVTTLLLGETGTGKDLVARVIHAAGSRRSGPFVNLPSSLLTREMITASMKTGTRRPPEERREESAVPLPGDAVGGTLYLNEISRLSPEVQPALLEWLERLDHEEKPGEDWIGVRILASSQVPLEDLVASGRLRLDLYYRLAILPIHLPPLRERPEDVAVLSVHFLALLAQRAKTRAKELHPETLRILERHSWPGNVRELANVLERAELVSLGTIYPENLELVAAYPPVSPRPDPERLRNGVERVFAAGINFTPGKAEKIVGFILSRKEQKFRMQDIADVLRTKTSGARRYVQTLVKAGLVERFGIKKGTYYQGKF